MTVMWLMLCVIPDSLYCSQLNVPTLCKWQEGGGVEAECYVYDWCLWVFVTLLELDES